MLYTTNPNQIVDSESIRISKIKNMIIVISVENTLPMFITLDNRLDEYTFKEKSVTIPLNDDLKLVDDEYQQANGKERWIYTGCATSPLTNNIVMFYYDRKYKDVLILPNLEYLKLGLPTMRHDISASRLGSGAILPTRYINQDVPNAFMHKYELAETKTNLSFKCKLTSLPGMATVSNNNHDDGFEELLQDGIGKFNNSINVRHNTRRLASLIELGAAGSLFNNPGSIPVYMLYQHSSMEFGLQYISNISTGNSKLYVRLKF